MSRAGGDVVVARPDGTFGQDFVEPGPGNDFVDANYALVSYARAPGPVEVDLGAGVSTGAHGDDVIQALGVIGSAYGDTLLGRATGHAPPEELWGKGGDDTIDGRGGSDRIRGGVGVDTCIAYPDTIDVTGCESG